MDILTQLKDNQDWKKLRTVFTPDEIRDLADIQTRINKLENKIEERLDSKLPISERIAKMNIPKIT